MRDAVICEPVRTPIGRYGGVFSSLTAVDLGVAALKGLLGRTGVGPDDVDDVILGHCYPSMEAPAIGRVVALDAGLPVTVPGMQFDRRCGSGLQAVIQALHAGGTGHERPRHRRRRGVDEQRGVLLDRHALGGARAGQGPRRTERGAASPPADATTRCPAACWRPPRTFAVSTRSRARAGRARGDVASACGRRAEGRPAGRPDHSGHRQQPGKGEVIDTDEHPRADTTVEALGKLKPVLGKQDPEATVTAGNSSGQNDAASMCIVTTPREGRRVGAEPAGATGLLGRRGCAAATSWASARCRRREVALTKAGLTLADVDLIELNEAFAAQALAVMREWKFSAADLERTNVRGPASRLAIRSARRAGECWPRSRARCTGARRGTASRRCASAAVRGWPRCSRR